MERPEQEERGWTEGWRKRGRSRRDGQEGWLRRGRDGRRDGDRWVVPGQSWEGAERLASQGERAHTHTHTSSVPVNSSSTLSAVRSVFTVVPCVCVCVDHVTQRFHSGSSLFHVPFVRISFSVPEISLSSGSSSFRFNMLRPIRLNPPKFCWGWGGTDVHIRAVHVCHCV